VPEITRSTAKVMRRGALETMEASGADTPCSPASVAAENRLERVVDADSIQDADAARIGHRQKTT